METGTRPFRWIAPYDFTIVGIQTSVGVQATGTGSVLVDVNSDSVPGTLFTTQANRPEIAVSTYDSNQEVPDVTAVSAGDVIEIAVDDIGGTLPGENLVVIMEVTVP